MSEPARSDIPDPDPDYAALHGPAGEYLAGILALSRLSRVTVACRSSAYPAANLLAVAKLTGIPGETALLFDQWQGEAGPDLAQALRAAVGGNAAALPGSDGPVLAILDRFEGHLGLPPDDARAREDGEILCALADDARADIHFLLLVEESATPLLQRYAARIPGITEASLRLPPHADGFGAELPALASASGARAANADARKRSFGALLERLTERSDTAPLAAAGAAEERAAPPAQAAAAFMPEAPAALADAGAAQPEPEPEVSLNAIAAPAPTEDAAPGSDVPQATAAVEPAPQAASARRAAAFEPAADPVAAPPAPARRRGGRLALAGIALAALALILVSRFPAKPDKPAAQVAQAPAQPSGAAAPAQAQAQPAPQAAAGADMTAPAAPAAGTVSAPAAQAAASTPTVPRGAATAVSRRAPTLYILVNSSRERERLRPIARNLARQGIEVINIQPIGRGPKATDLRYFYREEREDALKIQQALQDAGLAVRNVNLVQGYENRAPRRQLELWLAGDSDGAPAAAARRKPAAGR